MGNIQAANTCSGFVKQTFISLGDGTEGDKWGCILSEGDCVQCKTRSDKMCLMHLSHRQNVSVHIWFEGEPSGLGGAHYTDLLLAMVCSPEKDSKGHGSRYSIDGMCHRSVCCGHLAERTSFCLLQVSEPRLVLTGVCDLP